MGRLKRDHSGWRTSGLWLKYQSPQVNERQPKFNKRDTNKWCRGKIGREHVWHRYQQKRYSWELDDYIDLWVHIKCVECGKQKYTKTAKSARYPMHLYIKEKSDGFELIPVRINGEYLPVDYWKYQKDKKWCSGCGRWH